MDLDVGSGQFSGDGRVGQKLDSLDVLEKLDDSGILDVLDVLGDLDKNMAETEPGLVAGPGREKSVGL